MNNIINMIRDIVQGIRNYFLAFSLVAKLRLWKFFIWPGVLSILLGGGVLLMAVQFGSSLGNFADTYYPFERGAHFIHKISAFLGGTVLAASSLFLYKYLVMILVAPFMGPLSERVEAHYLDAEYKPIPFSIVQIIKDISRALYLSIRNIIRELFFTLLLLILSFVPLVNFVVPGLIFILQSYYAGFGNMDVTMERHLKKIGKRVGFAKRYKGVAIGNGIGFLLLLMIPFVGFFLAPALGVIGTTAQTIQRLKADGEIQYLSLKEDLV